MLPFQCIHRLIPVSQEEAMSCLRASNTSIFCRVFRKPSLLKLVRLASPSWNTVGPLSRRVVPRSDPIIISARPGFSRSDSAQASQCRFDPSHTERYPAVEHRRRWRFGRWESDTSACVAPPPPTPVHSCTPYTLRAPRWCNFDLTMGRI